MTYSVYVNNKLILSGESLAEAIAVCVERAHVSNSLALLEDGVIIAQWLNGYKVKPGTQAFTLDK